jgi:hypothetical protein
MNTLNIQHNFSGTYIFSLRTGIVAMLFFLAFQAASQGPGGIGDASGTNGPRNVIWLDASQLVQANGVSVSTWPDRSGNGNNFIQQAAKAVPVMKTAALGGSYKAVSFDGTERYLGIADNASLDGYTGGVSIIIVGRFTTVDSNPRGILFKRTSAGSSETYGVFTYTGSKMVFDTYTTSNSRFTGTTVLNNTTNYILSNIYDGANQFIAVQGVIDASQAKTGSVANTSSSLILGALNDAYGTYLNADIAEVITYGAGLTQAERIVVENYLSYKYGISIGANDHWASSASYSNDLAGIGQENTYASEATSAASSILRINESEDLNDNDWLFWGHDNASIASYTATDVITGSSYLRLAREWLVEETNDAGNVIVSVAASSLPATGLYSPSFYLMVDTDGDFSNATAHLMTLNGANYQVELDLATGNYLAISYKAPKPANVTGTLAFWYNTELGVENGGIAATNGQSVTVWQDLSAVNSDAVNGVAPTYYSANTINYHPIVRFNGSTQYKEFNMTALQGADYTIMAVVKRASSGSNQYIFGSQTNATDAMYMGYSSDTQIDVRNSSTVTANTTIASYNSPQVGPALVTVNYNSTNLVLNQFKNGVNNSATTATSTDYAATGYLGNLGRGLASNYFNGDIAEVIAFSTNL